MWSAPLIAYPGCERLASYVLPRRKFSALPVYIKPLGLYDPLDMILPLYGGVYMNDIFVRYKNYEEKQEFKFYLVWLIWHPETVIVSPGHTETKVYGANTLLGVIQQRKQVENAGGMIQGIRNDEGRWL